MNEEWLLFHRYGKLVRRRQAPALTCPVCDGLYVTALDQDDESLLLRCLACQSKVKPGLKTITNMKVLVGKYFE